MLDDTLRGAGMTDGVERVVERGRPGTVLAERSRDAQLLVLGNRGMSGPSRLMGSVSNRVTHQLSTNLLLVRTVV